MLTLLYGCFLTLIIVFSPLHSAFSGKIFYYYDSLNRLIQVDYPDGSTITYQYDSSGNMVRRQVTKSPSVVADAKVHSGDALLFAGSPDWIENSMAKPEQVNGLDALDDCWTTTMMPSRCLCLLYGPVELAARR